MDLVGEDEITVDEEPQLPDGFHYWDQPPKIVPIVLINTSNSIAF